MITRNNNIQNIIITSTVFIIGASTMILELVGSRLIAPYFGTTIFTWTSLIGIILGSLSIGYWLGGKLADKKATLKILSTIIFINSLVILFIYLFSNEILRFIFLQFKGIVLGTFISAVSIFSLPSVIFGMIPPYAAKFKITSLHTSGKTVGNLYAISTLGSIIGTFLTGFFLLSFIGSFQIILLLSLILLLNSIILDYKFLFIIKLLLFCLLIWLFVSNKEVDYIPTTFKTIHTTTSSYNNYYILEEQNTVIGPIRRLLTDFRGVQSAYVVQNKNALLFDYTKYFTFPECYGENKNVLMIGGGAFSYAKYFLAHFPENKIDVVEIDQKLTDISEKYFDLPTKRPNVNIINTDGRTYLNSNKKIYNAIIVDAYDKYSLPFHIVTKEALLEVNRSLTKNGVIVMNIISPIEDGKFNLLKAHYNTFKSIFPRVEIYKVRDAAQLDENQNVILIAFKNKETKLLSSCLFKQEGFDNNKVEIVEEKNSIILTDDYAPVEYL